MTQAQANDLPSRMSRAEDNIIDLRLAASALLQAVDKNSADIADLIEVSRQLVEVSRRNSEQIGRNSEQISLLLDSQARTDEAIRDIRASTERMDRLFDYLIRRDQGRSE